MAISKIQPAKRMPKYPVPPMRKPVITKPPVKPMPVKPQLPAKPITKPQVGINPPAKPMPVKPFYPVKPNFPVSKAPGLVKKTLAPIAGEKNRDLMNRAKAITQKEPVSRDLGVRKPLLKKKRLTQTSDGFMKQ